MTDIDKLAEDARLKKEVFLRLRSEKAVYDTLKRAAGEYSDAIEAWHKARFPHKKFRRPSVGYLLRAL